MAIIDELKPQLLMEQSPVNTLTGDGSGGSATMQSQTGTTKTPPEKSISGPLIDNGVKPPPVSTPPATTSVGTGTTSGLYAGSTATQPGGGGIIDAAQKTPAVTDPSTIKPVMGAVSSDSLIEDRLVKLLGSDSPLIARARQKAAENATARGLQNSSMAVQAGEAAAFDAALPIATGDATTYARQDLTNQDVTNQFLGEDKNLAGKRTLAEEDRTFQAREGDLNRSTQTSIAATNAATQAGIASMNAQNNAAIAASELAGRLQIAGMDAQTRMDLAKLDVDSKTSLNLSQLGQNSLVNFSNGFSQIQSSSLEPDAKNIALKNYMSIWAGSPFLPVGINLTNFPPTTTTGGG